MKVKDERRELEKIIINSPDNLEGNVPIGEDAPELIQEPTMDIDFDEVREACNVDAKRMIFNSISFMLTKEVIESSEYIQDKMNTDAISLSGMLYQLRCNEAMQKALMEEVKHGAMHPRMFEVFAQVSKGIGELNKQLIQTVEAIKMTYKDIKQDYREKQSDLLGGSQTQQLTGGTSNGGMLTYGTKDLIKSVNEKKKLRQLQAQSENKEFVDLNNNISDAEVIYEPPYTQL
jgi:hypothetical protein